MPTCSLMFLLVDLQVTTGVGSQPQNALSQIPTTFKNFSMSQKEKTLEELVQDQWLCFTPDGNIGLGLRSFLDLRSWFHSNDIPACEVCNEAGIKLCQVAYMGAMQKLAYSCSLAMKHNEYSSRSGKLVRDQWLCFTPDGNIGLGFRSFLDLHSWLNGNDIHACEICNEAGIKADLCKNEDCTIRMHQYCAKKKFGQAKVERVCPGCHTPWLPLPKIESLDVDDEINDTNRPSQSGPSESQPPPGPSVRKRLRICRATDSGDLVPNSSQASTSDLRRTTRSSARMR
ncbi:unnamed protein product [Thlaspi arvense]|uniref:Non-structural maintenance of chromosomes element 1 homolog n=1 Tax=Thlaspi arvense TaxID=13288 RepID=A0AAU9RMK8_THLAR|nr:unnamed protein product [Thlaspi arvense]